MGRSFNLELDHLSSTYAFAYNYNNESISIISNFLISTFKRPLFIVGSGGSFSVAKALEYMHNTSNISSIAKAVTPLELSLYTSCLYNSAVVLLTANGNNNDTINAYKFIKRCNPFTFMTICLNENSKVKKLTDDDSTIFVGQRLPTGKDGYLAVNSILAVIVWLSRAYERIDDTGVFCLPSKYESYQIQRLTNIAEVIGKESIIVLNSDISIPVAIDIESKFSEAALGNIQLSDYRNFAHGRHFWLSQRKKTTSIISLVTPSNKSLFIKTHDLVPKEISTLTLETSVSGIVGMLELFLNAFNLVANAGSYLGIDPGKPNVPAFGRKMYHISYTSLSAQQAKYNDILENRAALRKCDVSNKILFDMYKKCFKKFKADITKIKFKEIMFDYDATLKERHHDLSVGHEIFHRLNMMLDSGIMLKIATGRGKSVREELQEEIKTEHWNNVIIGYYNGGVIAPLSDNDAPSISTSNFNALNLIAQELQNILPCIQIELRPKQLTIILDDYLKVSLREFIIESARKYKDIKTFVSGHSIDIIPLESSKLNLIDIERGDCLSIGDSGHYQGNDYEMLSYRNSLSVNNVSASNDSCWNYAPLGVKNTKATLYYLEQIAIYDNYFKLLIK